MLKTAAISSFLTAALLILTAANFAWASTETLSARISVNEPYACYLKIVPWDTDPAHPTSTIGARNEINFSEGTGDSATPGRTSWDDIQGGGADDGFTSISNNVGFNVVAVGPEGSLLNIKCGKMKDTAGHEIPYTDLFGNGYFGFTARKIPSTDYLTSNGTDKMQPHSLSGWSYIFPVGNFGYEISVFNLLKIPANVSVGNYATTGSGNNTHLLITLM